MSDEIPHCKVKLKRGSHRAWQIEVNDSSPECLASLSQISKNMGRGGKSYLAKRITTSDPLVKKALEDAKLNT